MKDATDTLLESLQCRVLARHGATIVAIWMHIEEAYDAIDDKAQGRFLRLMEQWCEGRLPLTPKMLNTNEGRSRRHETLLQAFKGFKVRLYGFVCTIKGSKFFIIVDIDPAKKQDKADPTILKRAKERVDNMEDIVRGMAK